MVGGNERGRNGKTERGMCERDGNTWITKGEEQRERLRLRVREREEGGRMRVRARE